MPERQDYASKDLRRRPLHTALVLTSISVAVAFTVFLFLFGNIMIGITGYVTSGTMLSVLRTFFEGFIWAALVLVMILSVVIVSSTISLEMVSRRRDIGLMKSIGTEMDNLYDHFMAQAVLLLLGGVIIGLSAGTIIYLGSMLWLSNALSGIVLVFEYPIVQIGLLVLTVLFVGYFAAQYPVYQVVNETPMAALNPEIGMRVRRAGYLDSFGLPFRIATKASGRRVKGTRRMVLSLFLCITLASMLWVGGVVVETTTDAYILRSMGSNVVAVGDADLLASYYDAYSLTGSALNDSVQFIEESHMIPEELLSALDEIEGAALVERRLVEYESVEENDAIVWNPTLEQYERIGSSRVSSALVVGLDWDNTISDWYFYGDPVETGDDAWIGGQLANAMYDDPLIEGLGIRGFNFNISAIAFDVANGGMMAIISLERMRSLWGVAGANLALVQLEPGSTQLIPQIQQLARSYGLDIFAQDIVVNENIQTVAAMWYLLQPLPVMAMIGAFLTLSNYLLVSVSQRFRDYVIMRSVGAKPVFIAKTTIAEGLNVTLKAGIPGVLFSVLLSVFFLVPEAAVPSLLFLPFSFLLMMGVLVAVVMVSSVPVLLMFGTRSDLRVSEFSV